MSVSVLAFEQNSMLWQNYDVELICSTVLPLTPCAFVRATLHGYHSKKQTRLWYISPIFASLVVQQGLRLCENFVQKIPCYENILVP